MFIMIIIIIVTFGLYNSYVYEKYVNQITSKNIVNNTQENVIKTQVTQQEYLPDQIQVYDQRVLNDPFKDPKSRPPRHIIGPMLTHPYATQFNYPTRGFRDDYSQFGYLVDQKASTDDSNKILLLFGREKWPNSSEYEYYVVFQSGDKERKYDLDRYHRELYNGDKVTVDILNNRDYTVSLFKKEALEYNPFVQY